MSATITPESLRALADDVSSGQAGMVLFHSARNEIPIALRAAADEIERLKRGPYVEMSLEECAADTRREAEEIAAWRAVLGENVVGIHMQTPIILVDELPKDTSHD